MWRWPVLSGIVVLVLLGTAQMDALKAAETENSTAKKGLRVKKIDPICLNPVGVVKQEKDRAILTIKPEFAPALKGMEGFSHLWVFYWFHENDRPEARATLQVHPRRDPANPLTGVFACRAPERPNLIGITACRILKVQGNLVEVEGLDARDGSPILDLKPYIPEGDAIPGATAPEWVKGLHRSEKEKPNP